MEDYLDQLSITQCHLLRTIRNRTISEHLHLDFVVFEALHARPQMEAAVHPYGWRRLLCLAEPTYQELVWEFYASFRHSPKGSADHSDAVHFTLGGVEHSVSYSELASAFRLNSPHPSDRPLYVDITDPTDFASHAYFQRICLPNHVDVQYIASQTWATLLRPVWRILNHLLTQSYTPSRGSSNRVTLQTLFFMHPQPFHTRLDRERDRERRLMSGQHYIMSYMGLDPNAVHYRFVQSPGYEDEYPPPTEDGGDAF
ncbi:unnamed protein product [Linum trigynum]|uniref:Uncharacterized protein n=1 Tax=Linum trigynum TaxID=586398 RepID=A0AAV2CS03_9ROSI